MTKFKLTAYCERKEEEWSGRDTGFVLANLIATKLARANAKDELQAYLLYQDFLDVLPPFIREEEPYYEDYSLEYGVPGVSVDEGWIL